MVTVGFAVVVALGAFLLGLSLREVPALFDQFQLLKWRDDDAEPSVSNDIVQRDRDQEEHPDDDLNTISSLATFAPNKALHSLTRYIQRTESTLPPSSVIELKEQLAEQMTKTRRFEEAAALRTEILAARMSLNAVSAADFVLATATIAQDLQHAMVYDRALAALAQVPLKQLDAASKAIVTRMEADIHAWQVRDRTGRNLEVLL